MKLVIKQDNHNKHSDLVSCLAWTGNSELYSLGDDRKVIRWSGDGEHLGPVPTGMFEATGPEGPGAGAGARDKPTMYATCIDWFPSLPGKSAVDIYAVGGTDGKLYICAKGGRTERPVEAHKGAVLAVKWNNDGSAIITCGEDGQAKIWSRSGMLRSVLVQSGPSIYSAAWAPDGDQLLYSSGVTLVVKPLQPTQKLMQWKAHDGLVLTVDWNLVNNVILSGGEDRKYKVWDSFGRVLFVSAPHDHAVTAVRWNPSGDMFAVGAYNTIRICDKLGWSYALAKPESGSLFDIAWTPDGSQFACAGGNGVVCFGHVVERRLEWRNLEATVASDTRIIFKDVAAGIVETLEFRDRVIQASLSFGRLVVATSTQCYVYTDKYLNTPSIMDLTGNSRVITVLQSHSNFLIVDTVNGIQIFNYDARLVSQPKYSGLRPEFLNAQTMSLTSDTLAVRDKTDEKAIYLFEVSTGRIIGDKPTKHSSDVAEIALDYHGPATTRQLAVIDKNRELHIAFVMKGCFKKLGTMADTMAWNDDTNMLATVLDGKFVVWYYPSVVFIDEDIIEQTRLVKDGGQFGRDSTFVSFAGPQCTVRKADGTLITQRNISPLPALLHEKVARSQWEEAIRLCRFSKLKELWACLAAMAVNGNDLNTAEVAYAAIDEVQKVQYMCHIKSLPSAEARNANLALFRRRPDEAESILLTSGLVYRAIRMHLSLFNWDRALDIAVRFKTHVDTVLYFRGKYLKAIGRKETSRKFAQYAQGVSVEWENIKSKIKMEEENEASGSVGRAAPVPR